MAPKKNVSELRAAAEAAQKALQEALAASRQEAVSSIETILKDNELSIADLFADKNSAIVGLKEIVSVHAILPADLGFKAGTADKGGEKQPRAERKARASDANPILLTKTAERGRGFAYHQGRVYEQASDTVKTPWVINDKQFPKALLDNGDNAASLLKLAADDEAKAYFKTEDGKKELAKLVEVIAEAKKKIAGAPAAAA